MLPIHYLPGEGAMTFAPITGTFTVLRGLVSRTVGVRSHRFDIVWVVPIVKGKGLQQRITSITFAWMTDIFLLSTLWNIIVVVACGVFALSSGTFFVGKFLPLVSLFSFSFSAGLPLHCLQRDWSVEWQIWKNSKYSSIVILWYCFCWWTNMFQWSAEKTCKQRRVFSYFPIINSKSALRSLYNLKRILKHAFLPSMSYCMASLSHIEDRFEKCPQQQHSVCKKWCNFCIPSWWMQRPHLSRCHPLFIYHCTFHKPLSITLTRWCFCEGQSVCIRTPILHLNTCHWGFGKIHVFFIISIDF